MAISHDELHPLTFDSAAPSAGLTLYLQNPSLQRLVEFFQAKGLPALKEEDRQEAWYQDWIAYQAEHGLYASVLSPKRYSSQGHQFNLLNLTRFLEAFAYFSPAHAYSLHVSFLGLFPILMNANEALKQEAIASLENGGLFAFGVSEKAHGSDLFANESTVRPAGAAAYRVDGSKYYIGNANAACLISVFAKQGDAESTSTTKRAPFIFFALRPRETTAFRGLEKIRTLGVRTAFVGEFALADHSLSESDIFARGRTAWDTVHGTVDFGKFFLGFGAVGICEHAFAEAFVYLRGRVLYGKPVTEMPHIRATIASAFARLVAMKLYAYRALDYLQASSDADRRYLLWNAVQKAKVSTEGVKVMGLLSECIGARGVEAETYFELALRDAQLIPGLEGSTHINFGLTAQFIDTYFSSSAGEAAEVDSLSRPGANADENAYWFETRDRHPRTVRFAPYLKAYRPLRSVANVRAFRRQAAAFRQFAAAGVAALNPAVDAGLNIALGKCFSILAYAQLIAENCLTAKVALPTIALIFHGLTEDLSAEALKLCGMFAPGSASRALLRRVIRAPRWSPSDLESVSQFIAASYGLSVPTR